jgi:hypothetical protein
MKIGIFFLFKFIDKMSEISYTLIIGGLKNEKHYEQYPSKILR